MSSRLAAAHPAARVAGGPVLSALLLRSSQPKKLEPKGTKGFKEHPTTSVVTTLLQQQQETVASSQRWIISSPVWMAGQCVLNLCVISSRENRGKKSSAFACSSWLAFRDSLAMIKLSHHVISPHPLPVQIQILPVVIVLLLSPIYVWSTYSCATLHPNFFFTIRRYGSQKARTRD